MTSYYSRKKSYIFRDVPKTYRSVTWMIPNCIFLELAQVFPLVIFCTYRISSVLIYNMHVQRFFQRFHIPCRDKHSHHSGPDWISQILSYKVRIFYLSKTANVIYGLATTTSDPLDEVHLHGDRVIGNT